MKESYEKLLTYGLILFVIGLLVYSLTGFFNTPAVGVVASKQQSSIDPTGSPGLKSISTGSTNPGEVSIELVPMEIKKGNLVVKISANTHSVDLSQFDLKQITTLEYDGKTINPISAPSLGGHHSNGELGFEVDKEIDEFTIRIKGIPKVEERIFKWE